MKRLILCVILATASHSFADGLLFTCTTKNKKTINVTQNGNNIRYTFSQIGQKPELTINAPKSKVVYEPWNGIGRYITDAITLTNGEYSYNVYYGADKHSDDHSIEAGVSVSRNDQSINTIKCSNKYKIINNLSDFQI